MSSIDTEPEPSTSSENPEKSDPAPSRAEEDADEGPPEIEEDLLREELRIDGICGVY